MHRLVLFSLVMFALLAPFTVTATQGSTATPAALIQLDDPEAIASAISEADAPETLPGNVDTEVELVAWETHYGEALESTVGAWVLNGSPQLPIASILVFQSSESAQTGLEDYRRETSATMVNDLEAWSVADRGKWVCIAADGPVVIIAQAEPQQGDTDEDVQRRSCEALAATHDWLLEQVRDDRATPEASSTPGA